jgi:hypothetical protein
MKNNLASIFQPVDPTNFVGRTKELDYFFDWLTSQIRGDSQNNNWTHVYGPTGSGKTSILKKFVDYANLERVKVIELSIQPILGLNTDLLLQISEAIDNYTPEWRSFFQKKKKTKLFNLDEEDLDLLRNLNISAQNINHLIKKISENLASVNEKLTESRVNIGIFIDDIHRLDSENPLFILLYKLIGVFNKKQMRIFFVTSALDDFNTVLDDQFKNNLISGIELLNFDYNDADLMIRRRNKHTPEERELIVQNSTRYPFDLALRQQILLASGDVRELSIENLSTTFGLNDKLMKIFTELSKEDQNLFKISKIKSKLTEKELIELEKMDLFTFSNDLASFKSNAFWEVVKVNFLPIDVRTEMILKINRIEEMVENKSMPLVKDITSVKANITSIKDSSLLFELSSKLTETAKFALHHNLVHSAWEMIEIVRIGLNKTEDFEKLAEAEEMFGREFAVLGKDYLAALSYQASAENFMKIRPPKKIRAEANFREAGNRYKREAEKIDINTFHFALRSIYRKSVSAFYNANEPGSAREIMNFALNAFEKYPMHKKYLQKVEEST